MTVSWEQFDAFVLDLDGTIYLGDHLLPGAEQAVRRLREAGKRVVFVSNKPLQPPEAYSAKLTALGVPAMPEDVITPNGVLSSHLAAHHPGARVLVLGERPVMAELERAGIEVVAAGDVLAGAAVGFVVASFDRTLTYEKLNAAHQAIRRGARLVATNPDPSCPVEGGDVPDAGAIIAALRTSTGCELDWVAGKPSPLMVETALARLGASARATLLAGDRAATDVAMARRAGMTAVLVLTGVTRPGDVDRLPPELRPDAVVHGIAELVSPAHAATHRRKRCTTSGKDSTSPHDA